MKSGERNKISTAATNEDYSPVKKKKTFKSATKKHKTHKVTSKKVEPTTLSTEA